jgi:hypothetical protein
MGDSGTLLPILALHLALTGLPGAAAALFAARRGMRRQPLLLAIGLAATGIVAIVSFWAFYADPLVGKAFAWLVPIASVATIAWSLAGRRIDRALLRGLAIPAALWALGSAFVLFLGFGHGGVDTPLATATTRFSGELPSDIDIPRFFAEWFYFNGHEGTVPVYPGGWLSSDRPPLQVGYVLSQRPVAWDGNGIGLHYEVLGVVLQQLWIVGLWALLLAAGVGRVTRAVTVALVLVSGLVLVNGFYVWPKLLPAAFLLAAAALVLTPLWERLRGDPRAAALLAALLALALLGHGASVFAALGLAAVAALRGLPSLRWLGVAVAAGAVLMVPWLAYQSYGDPPGDRLQKWMLAGAVEVDERSTPEAIVDEYSEQGLGGAIHNKGQNFVTIAGGGPAFESARDAVEAAGEGELDDAVGRLRGIAFFYLLPSLGGLLLAPILMAARRRRRCRDPTGESDWRFALVCFAVFGVSCLAWALLLFGSQPSRTVLHVSSYAMPLLAIAGAVAGLRAVAPRFSLWYLGALGALGLALYVPSLDPPPGTSYEAVPLLLAAASLAGFVVLALCSDRDTRGQIESPADDVAAA